MHTCGSTYHHNQPQCHTLSSLYSRNVHMFPYVGKTWSRAARDDKGSRGEDMTFGRERERATTSMNMQVNVSDLCMCACVLQVRDRHVQELQTEILTKDGQLQQKDQQLEQLRDEKDRNIQQLQQKDRLFRQLRDEKDRNIQHKDRQIREKDRQMEVELGPGLCFHGNHAISHLYM